MILMFARQLTCYIDETLRNISELVFFIFFLKLLHRFFENNELSGIKNIYGSTTFGKRRIKNDAIKIEH